MSFLTFLLFFRAKKIRQRYIDPVRSKLSLFPVRHRRYIFDLFKNSIPLPGVEPGRSYEHAVLSRMCLPIPPEGLFTFQTNTTTILSNSGDKLKKPLYVTKLVTSHRYKLFQQFLVFF